MGQRLEQRAELWRRLDHLLEVVEQEQQLTLADVLDEAVLCAERPCNRLRDECRIAERGEPDPEDAGLELGNERGPQPRSQAASCPCLRARSKSTRRAPSSTRDNTSNSSSSRPTNELAGRGRLVLEIVLSGGKEQFSELEDRRLPPRCP